MKKILATYPEKWRDSEALMPDMFTGFQKLYRYMILPANIKKYPDPNKRYSVAVAAVVKEITHHLPKSGPGVVMDFQDRAVYDSAEHFSMEKWPKHCVLRLALFHHLDGATE